MHSRRNFLRNIAAGSIGIAGGSEFLGKFFARSPVALSQVPDDELWQMVSSQFRFADGITYFNNASLGTSPIVVRQATQEFRDTLDDFPSKYMWGGWDDEKEATRKAVADLFSVSPEEIALIHNTTEGMNVVARSFDLEPGDEVILVDHEHASGTIPWKFWQETKGIKLVRPEIPVLPESPEEIAQIYANAITPKTRLISMCHTVNTNGMILPVKEVSELAHARGILVAVDGAQAAGMFRIDLADLGCDFYAASSHKWLFSPKGVGIFYARKSSQRHLRPLIVARGYDEPGIRRFENYNTRNLPEVLGLNASVAFLNDIGMQKIEQRSYALKRYFREKVADSEFLQSRTPEHDRLSAAIQNVEVIDKSAWQVRRSLERNYGIDCRPMSRFGLNSLRISLAVYILEEHIDQLVDALEEIAQTN